MSKFIKVRAQHLKGEEICLNVDCIMAIYRQFGKDEAMILTNDTTMTNVLTVETYDEVKRLLEIK